MPDKNPMADHYSTFADLAANETLGVDYQIRFKDRGTQFVILAPHGGCIEPGTSQIAKALAGIDISFYAFEALKNGPHGDFHITSHRFDEPKALQLVGRSWAAIAIHGRQNEGNEAVWLGGRAVALCRAIGDSLRDAGFYAEPNKRLPGLQPTNICNRTLSGEGVQLELPRSLRQRLTSDAHLLQVFCGAVRSAILSSSTN
jgi:phage replication-related protein YjqB (UPF0714/DUF867 family)